MVYDKQNSLYNKNLEASLSGYHSILFILFYDGLNSNLVEDLLKALVA